MIDAQELVIPLDYARKIKIALRTVTDANGKPYRFGMTGSRGESNVPTATCSRCGDTIPAANNICTSIADCVNFRIRSKWIIPGEVK